MSLIRFRYLLSMELRRNIRRPLFIILAVLVVLLSWGLSLGNVSISSGDSSVGGAKALITSEHNVAWILGALIPQLYLFFVSISAGMTVLDDEEMNIGPLLHATPLTAGEYIWGKFLAVCLAYFGLLALQVAAMILCNHVLPHWQSAELIGPFAWSNYVRPALWFGMPTILFLTGLAFTIGAWTRKAILVYIMPIAYLVAMVLFLFSWSPAWLDLRMNQAIMLIDPSGFRWFNETWLKVDRGVVYYNDQPVTFDEVFYANRLLFISLGLGLVSFTHWRFARTLRGVHRVRAQALVSAPLQLVQSRPLPALGRAAQPPGLFAGMFQVARFELKELVFRPGLYLFVPLILIQTVSDTMVQVGFLDAESLKTPGLLAVGMMMRLTLWTCLLLLFYSVESLEREHGTGLAPILFASPVRTASLLFGKTLANSAVGGLVLLTGFVAAWIVLLWQQRVPMDVMPFALVWGLLLMPTFMVWTAFVLFVHTLCRNRYATYATTIAFLVLFGWLLFTQRLNWVNNWALWNSVRWTDMGILELDRWGLILNRIFVLSLTVLLVLLTVRWYRRRETDPVQFLSRFHFRFLFVEALRLSPAVVVPAIVGGLLWYEMELGMGGAVAKRQGKDYWKQNLATWKDAPLPVLKDLQIHLELEPIRNWFRVSGVYQLLNENTESLRKIPLTGGSHWQNVSWTLNGDDFKPDNRSGLYVFTLPKRLRKGDTVSIGFALDGKYPFGLTRNGGGAGEFILPSGVLLNSFSTAFAPMLGYVEQVGVDNDNSYEPRQKDDDYLQEVKPMSGLPTPFRTKIQISGPAEYTYNAVGTLVKNEVADGRRTVVWESDFPVRAFNVVAGRWDCRSGDGVMLYYHPKHSYNLDEMVLALESARKYYSLWFAPYPWKELKLSMFPSLADYAQGFATNIVFTETGFLAKSEPMFDGAFMITAHEAAHQWWGNLLGPGDGPGGNILSEGMAHYSTMLLLEQVKGLAHRIEFCKRLENNYSRQRRFDAERPLVRIVGDHAGDSTVTYDKGSWVFWMLQQLLGRERMLQGLRAFIEKYRTSRDHPLLQDLLSVLRPLAADATAFDRFTRMWFFEVVLPEYQLSDVRKTQVAGGWQVTFHLKNAGTGRMPIEVAATVGERFGKDANQNPEYQEVRKCLTLDAGEEQEVVLNTSFDPEHVVVDPDAKVLQLFRSRAVHRFR